MEIGVKLPTLMIEWPIATNPHCPACDRLMYHVLVGPGAGLLTCSCPEAKHWKLPKVQLLEVAVPDPE